MAHKRETIQLTSDELDAMLAANDSNLRAELRRLREKLKTPEDWIDSHPVAGLYGERSARKCDGSEFHNIDIDFVSFIQHPNEVWRKHASGSADEIRRLIVDLQAQKEPDVEIFPKYCCDTVQPGKR